MKKHKTHTYAFDFDGVIARYSGYRGLEHTGKPIMEVVRAIRELKKMGHRILIYSTRSKERLKHYCEKYKIPVDYYNENPHIKVENPGKPGAYVYIDDRSVLYKGQKAKQLVKQIIRFKAHWEL